MTCNSSAAASYSDLSLASWIAGGLGVAAFVSPAGGAVVSSISLTAIVIAFLKRRTESDEDEKDDDKH